MIYRSKKYKSGRLGVYVEETKKEIVENPDCVLYMDKIIFKDKSYTVVKVNKNEIILTAKMTVKKEELEEFLKGAIIERSECFKF